MITRLFILIHAYPIRASIKEPLFVDILLDVQNKEVN